MKNTLDVASIKNKYLRRAYVVIITPIILVVFTIIAAYEMAKALILAVYDTFTDVLPSNFAAIALALNYCWIGKEEYERREKIKHAEKVNRAFCLSSKNIVLKTDVS